MEGTGPVETAKGSVRLIKGKWGEGVTGLVSIAAWSIIAFVPIAIALGAGLAIRPDDPNLGAALIAIAIGGLLLIAALALATPRDLRRRPLSLRQLVSNHARFAEADLAEPFNRGGKRD